MTREISGDDGEPFGGKRVGVSVLRVMNGDESMVRERESPRGSWRVENQLSWWAFTSPSTRESPPSRKSRRGPMSKEKLGGQEEAGGT